MAHPRDRDQLRRNIKQQRRALSAEALESAGAALCQHLQQLPPISAGSRVGGYLAANGEIPVDAALAAYRDQGCYTYVPVIIEAQLQFVPLQETTPLQIGKFNIRIPQYSPADALMPEQLDLVLVPLVVFDTAGHRLGMGGGFYDQSFAFRLHQQPGSEQRFVGVAHHFQHHDDLPQESWDVPLDMIVTDQGIISPAREHDAEP